MKEGTAMLPTTDVIFYMIKRVIPGTDVIDAAFDDPVLLQAERDGYAVREDGHWRGLGDITPGERRILRHADGDVEEIVG